MENLIAITSRGVKIYFDDYWDEYIVKPSQDEMRWFYAESYNDAMRACDRLSMEAEDETARRRRFSPT